MVHGGHAVLHRRTGHRHRRLPAGTSNELAHAEGGAGAGAGADVEITGTPGGAGVGGGAAVFTPQQILLIDFPVGSRVPVETANQLTATDWAPLTTITNLPFAPYPYTCCADPSDHPQQFFRAVLEP